MKSTIFAAALAWVCLAGCGAPSQPIDPIVGPVPPDKKVVPVAINHPDGRALLAIDHDVPGRRECELSLQPESRTEALRKLKEVAPALAEPVLILLLDDNSQNHTKALEQLAASGNAAIPAFPVLLWHSERALAAPPAEINTDHIIAGLKVLVAAAPEKPAVLDYVTQHTRWRLKPSPLASEAERQQVEATQKTVRGS